MTIHEIDLHATIPGRLRLDLPDDPEPEEVTRAVADELARRGADFRACQGRFPL